MQTLAGQLPPLEALVAFEAAARHSSFTKAARELNLTQAAVSQRIRNLEQALGKKLFDREHRLVRLNAFGRDYQHTVSMALLHLAAASRSINSGMETGNITVAADEAAAALWLMPRISGFLEKDASPSIRMIVSDNLEDCFVPATDIALVFGGGDISGFERHELFPETVFPVCSPSYLEKNPGVANLDELSRLDLIDLEDDRWDWMNWQIWMTEQNTPDSGKARTLRIGSYPLVIEAACQGLGIALGWGGLVDDLVKRGDLVTPVDHSVSTGNAYNLFVRSSQEPTSPVSQFANWVIEEANLDGNLKTRQ